MPLAVFYIDLDYFKALNDYAGHAAGDQALKTISDAIRGVMPKRGIAARLGGDEFALVVPRCDTVEASQLAECLLGAVRDADLGAYSGARRIAASIGIAFVTDADTSVADALACADDACYAAKAAGRNRASIFSAWGQRGNERAERGALAADTLDALDDERLVLYGQEIHDLDSPIRRGNPHRGACPPDRQRRTHPAAGRVHPRRRALRHGRASSTAGSCALPSAAMPPRSMRAASRSASTCRPRR